MVMVMDYLDHTLGDCAYGWTYFYKTKKCYRYVRKELTWDSARIDCQGIAPVNDGDLASAADKDTQAFLKDLIGRGGKAWIGGYLASLGGRNDQENVDRRYQFFKREMEDRDLTPGTDYYHEVMPQWLDKKQQKHELGGKMI